MSRTGRSLLVVLAAALAVPAGTDAATSSGTVVGVRDGDTVRVRVAGVVRTVDLLGIRAASSGACYGRADARAELADLLPRGARVRLVTDPRHAGRGRYVLRGSTFVNQSMVARGAARASGSSALRRMASLRAAQRGARGAGRGLWASCDDGGGAPEPAPSEQPAGQTPTPAPGTGTPPATTDLQAYDAALRDTRIALRRSGGTGDPELSFTEDIILSFCRDGRFVFQRTLVSPSAGNEQQRLNGTWRADQVFERTADGISGLVAIDARDVATGEAQQGTMPIAITGPETARVNRNGEIVIGRRSSLGGTCP